MSSVGSKSLTFFYLFVFSMLAGGAAILLSASSPTAIANTTTIQQCPTTYSVSVNSPSGPNQLSEVAEVTLQAQPLSPTTSTTITRVNFSLGNDAPLGRGRPLTSDPYKWFMRWLTTVSDDGQYQIRTRVLHSDGFECLVGNTPQVKVFNSFKQIIPVGGFLPTSWSGPTNYPVDFEVTRETTTTEDFRPFMQIRWKTSIGSVAPLQDPIRGRFASGPTAGSGAVTATVLYGGKSRSIDAPVQVLSSATSESTNTTETTINPIQQTATETTINPIQQTATEQLLNSNSELKDCLEQQLGTERLNVIQSGQGRATRAEFLIYRECTNQPSFVVIPALAPVAPSEVRSLRLNRNATIVALENRRVIVEDAEQIQLVINGTAPPNSIVLIYVFSEPLVLTTVANASGEWTYTLEDPLAPGEHEVYTVVDTGNGEFERTDVLSFFIERAGASPENPNGFSLQLGIVPTAQPNESPLRLFILGSTALITLCLITLWVILRIRHSRRLIAELHGNPSTQVITPDTPINQSRADSYE